LYHLRWAERKGRGSEPGQLFSDESRAGKAVRLQLELLRLQLLLHLLPPERDVLERQLLQQLSGRSDADLERRHLVVHARELLLDRRPLVTAARDEQGREQEDADDPQHT